MKPARLRPQAIRDQQNEVRYYRKEAGAQVAVRLARASHAALDRIERDPGLGSPLLGHILQIEGLRTWQVTRFPLRWFCFERADHLDVIRLLNDDQDVAAILQMKRND